MPTSREIFERFETRYAVSDAAIDHTHREFLALCLAAEQAPGSEFAARFQALFAHTRAHFADEEARMLATAYPALGEHRAHHRALLGDLQRFAQRAAAGRDAMARAWLGDSLLQWFDLHARTMDSALAVHLRQPA